MKILQLRLQNRWECNFIGKIVWGGQLTASFIMGRIDPVECASEFLNREMNAHEISTTRHVGVFSDGFIQSVPLYGKLGIKRVL